MKVKGILIIAVFLIIAMVAFEALRFSKKEVVTATVTDKERITESNGDNGVTSYYLIYTDKGTYTLKDELLVGNFTASDDYGKIMRDTKYKFTVIGFRIGFMSSYQNIIEFEQVKVKSE